MNELPADQAERFPRRTIRRQNTRRRILREASRLFDSIGYGGTTMNAIADAADVHVTTLFTHFKSKQDLASSVNDAALEQLELLIAKAIGKVAFFSFFRQIVMEFVGRLEGERDPNFTLWRELERDPALALAWATYEHRQVVILAGYIAAEYRLPPTSHCPLLVAGLMVSASWHAHRIWSADPKGLDLRTETLAALDIAETMSKSVLEPAAAPEKAAPRKTPPKARKS